MRTPSQQFIHGQFTQGGFQLKLGHQPIEHSAVQDCAATIGSFDGVHIGHQALLEHVVSKAKALNVLSLVIVFEPQPHEFFSKEQAPARLMRLREKVSALLQMGVDRVVCLRFNQAFRELSAESFVRQVLCEGLNVRHLTVGDDFRFGKQRKGDFALLQKMAAQCDYSVVDTQTLLATTAVDGNHRVSSTRIRALLEQDQFDQARLLLGKPFSVSGRVIYGRQIGRTIGFPTANIGLGRYRSPITGVFGVKLHTDQGVFNAVANVGVRPTVGAREKPILEVHALGLQNSMLNLYGSCVRAEFLFKIRTERKFEDLNDLKVQILKDVETASAQFLP